MSRLFHTLVVCGAALSASSCGGESARQELPDDQTGGQGGTSTAGAGGSGTGGGTAGAANGGSAMGGSATGGTAAGGSATGGSATGGTSSAGGPGAGSGGGAGTPFPEPGAEAQWDCTNPEGLECTSVLNSTAAAIPESCPVDPTRPLGPEDCATTELFTCYLAVTPSGRTLLVNCECQDRMTGCALCTRLGDGRFGNPAYCDVERKVCACAYTGILR